MKKCIIIIAVLVSYQAAAQTDVKTTRETHLIDSMSQGFGKVLSVLKPGETVRLSGYENGFYKASVADLGGYIYYPYLSEALEAQPPKKQWEESYARQYKAQRMRDLVKRFGDEDARKIINNEVWVGMSPAMARASVGAPQSVNSTESAYGNREQWVYENRYLYFEDGKLTTIQETKRK